MTCAQVAAIRAVLLGKENLHRLNRGSVNTIGTILYFPGSAGVAVAGGVAGVPAAAGAEPSAEAGFTLC